VNSPLLKKKGLDQIKDADTHEDTIDPEQHTHLNFVERRRLSAMRKASAVDTMADRIVKSFHSIKGIPEVMAGEGWYSKMRQKLAEHLGEHHELFAQLLGATSAKTPVRENFMQALDALEQFKGKKFDRHIQKYLEAQMFLRLGGKEALTQHMRDEGILGDDQPDHATDADAMATGSGTTTSCPCARTGRSLTRIRSMSLRGPTRPSGPVGPPGLMGPQGVGGASVYTTLTQAFTVPPVGSTALGFVVDAAAFSVGLVVYVAGAGYFGARTRPFLFCGQKDLP
jgi:hypothetical protein